MNDNEAPSIPVNIPPPLMPKEDKVSDWRAVALFLWDLLDDIDTADDMAKGNHDAYRNRVQIAHNKRFEVGITDGQEVRFRDRRAPEETDSD